MARNSLLLLGSQVFGVLTTLIYVPLLARYLGTTDYGRYSYAYAFVGLFEMLSVLGLHQVVERETARDRANAGRYLGSALWIKLFLVLGTFLLIITLNLVVNESIIWLMVLLVAAENLIRKYTAINRNIGRAFERMEYDIAIVSLDRLVALVGVLFAIWADLGLIGILVAFLLASITQAIVSSALVWRRLARPIMGGESGLGKHLWKESVPIGVTLEGEQIYQRQGTFFLAQWRGPQATGLFSAAFRMYQITRIVADSVVGALFPVFSRLAHSSHKGLSYSFSITSKYLLVLASSIAIICWSFAPLIVGLLFGPDFGPSVSVLRWLSPAIVLTSLTVLFGFFLQAANKQKLGTYTMGVALVLNLVLNVLLIPRFGLIGVVWAWLASEGVAFCLGGYYSARQIDAAKWLESLLMPGLGVLAAAFLLFALADQSPIVMASAAELALLSIAFFLPRLIAVTRTQMGQWRYLGIKK